jgi:hypothetical protein
MTSTDADRPIFIFAGYLREMETFLNANPGMARRIAFKFHFVDFSTLELARILQNKCADRKLELSEEAQAALPEILDLHFPAKIRSLWNAGLAGRLLSEAVQSLNKRLVEPAKATRKELITIEVCDLRSGSESAAQAVCALASAFAEDGCDPQGEGGRQWKGSRGGGNIVGLVEAKGGEAGEERSGKKGGGLRDEGLRMAAKGRLSESLMDTLQMKLYLPSALRRIAALELQLQQTPSDDENRSPPCPTAAPIVGVARAVGNGVPEESRGVGPLVRGQSGGGEGVVLPFGPSPPGPFVGRMEKGRGTASDVGEALQAQDGYGKAESPGDLSRASGDVGGSSGGGRAGDGKGRGTDADQRTREWQGAVTVLCDIVSTAAGRGDFDEVVKALEEALALARRAAAEGRGAEGCRGEGWRDAETQFQGKRLGQGGRGTGSRAAFADPLSHVEGAKVAEIDRPGGGGEVGALAYDAVLVEGKAVSEREGGEGGREGEDADALVLWLLAVRGGRVKLGDEVPKSWREGLHFVRNSTQEFAAGETVVALRSNGKRTVAKIVTVKPGGTIELMVGKGLQKMVRSKDVGKLSSALADFVQDVLQRQAKRHGGGRGESRSGDKDTEVMPSPSSSPSPSPASCAGACLGDSDFWCGGELGIDKGLLLRLRELSLQEGHGWGKGAKA